MRGNNSGKFSGYRTVALATDHTDAIGYLDIQTWPTLDDCLIAAWDIASQSTWRKNMSFSTSLPVKWVIGQAMVLTESGIGHWRTIEVIALNHDGSRVLHSISDKSGIPFDFDSPDGLFGPIPYCTPGVSSEIRNALIHKLGYIAHVASLAVIVWRKMDNGQYGWVADMPNGSSHMWADGDFRRPVSRVELSPVQVSAMLVQLDLFTSLFDSAWRVGDLDGCEVFAQYVLALSKLIG